MERLPKFTNLGASGSSSTTRTAVRRVLRSPREIGLMRAAGLVVWEAHQAAARRIEPGCTTARIDAAIRDVFQRHDAIPLFLGYPGKVPFPAATCISVNNELVHGIPGNRQLARGDIVSIDTGCRLNGWCGDAAVTHEVGNASPKARRVMKVTHDALNVAVEQMPRRPVWSEVAREMQSVVETAGFSVVTSMVGHAIGQEMHERPQVPNYYDAAWVEDEDFALRPGVVLAVEPMVTAGKPDLRILSDHWTAVTKDGSLCAHFEHTIALTRNGSVRLTGPPATDAERAALPDWLADDSEWIDW